MELTPELLTGAFVGFLILLGGLGRYLDGRRNPPRPAMDTSASVIGLELGNRHQMERLIEQVERIGDILADKKSAELMDTQEQMLELLRRMDRSEKRYDEERNRRHDDPAPPRRR